MLFVDGCVVVLVPVDSSTSSCIHYGCSGGVSLFSSRVARATVCSSPLDEGPLKPRIARPHAIGTASQIRLFVCDARAGLSRMMRFRIEVHRSAEPHSCWIHALCDASRPPMLYTCTHSRFAAAGRHGLRRRRAICFQCCWYRCAEGLCACHVAII